MNDNLYTVETPSVSSDFPIGKKRHGCLTAWLILMIVANALTAILIPLSAAAVQQTNPNFPVWVLWVTASLAVLNILFAAALLAWKKWGFYGFAVNSGIAFGLNLYAGLPLQQAFVGLGGILLLFLVLQIGGDRKGWTQLE